MTCPLPITHFCELVLLLVSCVQFCFPSIDISYKLVGLIRLKQSGNFRYGLQHIGDIGGFISHGLDFTGVAGIHCFDRVHVVPGELIVLFNKCVHIRVVEGWQRNALLSFVREGSARRRACVLRNCGLRRDEGLGISHSEITLIGTGAIKRGVMIRILQISGGKLSLVLR